MGLLAEIYSVFGLCYSIALIKLKHSNFSRTDTAFIVASAAFLGWSLGYFLNELRVIPWGYKRTFFGKSILRGLLGPLQPLLLYPVLFCSNGCMKHALTFSNEAYDGVERTRQLVVYELGEVGSQILQDSRYLTTHSLLWYEKEQEWGYERLVGEIWVTVRFKADFANVVKGKKLQTSEFSTRLVLQHERDPNSEEESHPILDVDMSSCNASGFVARQIRQESWKVSCLDCKFVYPANGASNLSNTSPHSQPPPSSQTAAVSQPPAAISTPSTPQTLPPFQAAPPSQTPPPPQPATTSRTQPPSQPASPSPPPSIPQTPSTRPLVYEVTITRRCKILRIRPRQFRGRWIRGWKWALSSAAVRHWTLLQIHQYMVCLDVWGTIRNRGFGNLERRRAAQQRTSPAAAIAMRAPSRRRKQPRFGTVTDTMNW